MNSKINQSKIGIEFISVSAVMLALAAVLSYVKVYTMPYGGSVTLASMVPIMLISLRYGFGPSVLSAVTYGVLQMVLGFYPPPVQDFTSFAAVVLLDYLVAFGVLAICGPIARKFKNISVGAAFGAVVASLARFICHLLSGVLIWAVYAPEGQSAFVYSLIYNGQYMLLEAIISAVVLFLVAKRMTQIKL